MTALLLQPTGASLRFAALESFTWRLRLLNGVFEFESDIRIKHYASRLKLPHRS